MAEMSLRVARGFKTGTRISTIEVPAALRVKRTSGLLWLDDALGGEGGFTPTTTMMLTGGPGAGKSTLVRQLANSMTKAGHIVVYNTGEESLYQAKMACERLKLKEDFMVGEETNCPKLLEFMDNVKKAHPKKQVVLLQDSLQTLDDMKYADAKGESRGTTSKTPTACAKLIVDWAQNSMGIAAFIGQCTKGGEFAGQNTIKHAIDTHAHMFMDDKEKSDTYGCLLFEVQKNRWGCNGKTFMLGLTNEGIEERGHFQKAGGPTQKRNVNDEQEESDAA
jgi:DNA repair protein RadA/Sms